MSTIDLRQAVKTNNIEWAIMNIDHGTISWAKLMIESVKRGNMAMYKIARPHVPDFLTYQRALKKAVQRNDIEFIKLIMTNTKFELLHQAAMYAIEMNNLPLYCELCISNGVNFHDDALYTAVCFNHPTLAIELENKRASPLCGFKAAVECGFKVHTGVYYKKLNTIDMVRAKDYGLRTAIDLQSIEMLEHLIALGAGSWKEVQSIVANRTDVPIVKAHLNKVGTVNKEDMLKKLLKEENIAELEQLVSKSETTNLRIASIAETLGEEKIAKYFLLKCFSKYIEEKYNEEVSKRNISNKVDDEDYLE